MKKRSLFCLAVLLLVTQAGCSSGVVTTGSEQPSTTAPVSTAASRTTVPTADSKLEQEVAQLMNNTDLTNELYQKALVSEGNSARIAKAMKKAQSGEPVTVGYIGGSITAGSAATTTRSAYASLISDWWKCRFPQSKMNFVNAGIGATGSIIGVHRVQADLLAKKPDFVVVEYAVNDAADMVTKEAYECLIRRILQSENNPGVVLLFMVKEDGTTAQAIQREVGEHYGLPMISYGDAVTAAIGAKTFQWKDIGADNTHPNDRGHKLAASMVVRFLNDTYTKLSSLGQDSGTLPDPITDIRYMTANILFNKDITPESLGGWETTDKAFWAFPNGWIAKTKKDPLVFKVKAKEVYALVKMTTNGKGGTALVYVDGQYVVTLNTNFVNGWGDYAASCRIVSEETEAEHTIKIEYIDQKASSSDGTDFALLGLMVS